MPETRATARVVHINPLNLHKLSTDLSFVDNLGPGVQSRSNHNTGCVAQAHPGLPPNVLQVVAADRIHLRIRKSLPALQTWVRGRPG